MISDRLTVVIHSHGEPRNNWLLKILDSSVIQDFHQVKKRANLRLNHINSKKDGFCLVTRVWQKKILTSHEESYPQWTSDSALGRLTNWSLWLWSFQFYDAKCLEIHTSAFKICSISNSIFHASPYWWTLSRLIHVQIHRISRHKQYRIITQRC